MKKSLIILLAAISLLACKKNEEIKFDKTASEGITGTYQGTWTRSLDDDVVSGEGFVTFTATDDPYVCVVTATCDNPAINRSGIANVAHSDYEYVFYNNSVKEEAGFGTRFSGRVYKDNSIDMQYSVEEQVGRFKNTYQFSFEGEKVMLQ
jgi:hypothetical protein